MYSSSESNLSKYILKAISVAPHLPSVSSILRLALAYSSAFRFSSSSQVYPNLMLDVFPVRNPTSPGSQADDTRSRPTTPQTPHNVTNVSNTLQFLMDFSDGLLFFSGAGRPIGSDTYRIIGARCSVSCPVCPIIAVPRVKPCTMRPLFPFRIGKRDEIVNRSDDPKARKPGPESSRVSLTALKCFRDWYRYAFPRLTV